MGVLAPLQTLHFHAEEVSDQVAPTPVSQQAGFLPEIPQFGQREGREQGPDQHLRPECFAHLSASGPGGWRRNLL